MSDRKTALGILDELGVDYTQKISAERAMKKVERHVKKNGIPENLTPGELKMLTEMGFDVEAGGNGDEAAPKKEKTKKEKADNPAKPAKKEKTKKEKRLSNVNLMKQLVKDEASDKEIKKAFHERYAKKNPDAEWLDERIAIYKNIAGVKKASVKKADKPAKKKK